MITLHSLYTLIQMNNGVFDKVEAKKRRTTPQEARKVMAEVIRKKRTIKKAIYREDLGFVDFVWGYVGDKKIRPDGSRKGEKGVAHILEARQRKDNKTEAEAAEIAMQVAEMLVTIDLNIFKPEKVEDKMIISNGKLKAVLVKNKNDKNRWLLTGYEVWNKKTT